MKGGKRENAGRKKGTVLPKTLEKQAVAAQLRQRTMRAADKLWNAQFAKATGSMMIYRIDEIEDENGKTKREHILVENADEIKQVLDECDGASGYAGESYYIVTTVQPDNKAIDSMLDRTFGKAQQTIEVVDEVTAKYKNAVQELIDKKAAKDGKEAVSLLESVGYAPPSEQVKLDVINLGNVG